jgi:hypothetical protein
VEESEDENVPDADNSSGGLLGKLQARRFDLIKNCEVEENRAIIMRMLRCVRLVRRWLRRR